MTTKALLNLIQLRLANEALSLPFSGKMKYLDGLKRAMAIIKDEFTLSDEDYFNTLDSEL